MRPPRMAGQRRRITQDRTARCGSRPFRPMRSNAQVGRQAVPAFPARSAQAARRRHNFAVTLAKSWPRTGPPARRRRSPCSAFLSKNSRMAVTSGSPSEPITRTPMNPERSSKSRRVWNASSNRVEDLPGSPGAGRRVRRSKRGNLLGRRRRRRPADRSAARHRPRSARARGQRRRLQLVAAFIRDRTWPAST